MSARGSCRYKKMFETLDANAQGAFVPFVLIGDPTPERSLNVIKTLIESGADALELGIPFSDPSADGPTIQAASIRALNAGTTPDICFGLLKEIRQLYPDIPIGLLMYANLVFANGIDNFYRKCAESGVDSVLIADVPTGESEIFRRSAKKHAIHCIFIAPPDADDATLKDISSFGGGYTYLLSRAGVTGAENKAGKPIGKLLTKLVRFEAPPPLLGFGISNPSQVKEAIDAGAAGAICGSAIVKFIEKYLDNDVEMLANLGRFVTEMKSATRQ